MLEAMITKTIPHGVFFVLAATIGVTAGCSDQGAVKTDAPKAAATPEIGRAHV